MADRDWNAGERANLLWERLSQHFDDIHVTPLRWSLEEWDRKAAPYGYTMPMIGVGGVSVRLCPERIAETAMWLNEFDLDEYLTSIEVQLDWRIAHHAMAPDEAEVGFLAFIRSEAPGTLMLVQAVQERSNA